MEAFWSGWWWPAATAVLGLVFAGLIFAQWVHRRKPHQLAWAVGMLFYAVAAVMESVSEFTGVWNPTVYRVYIVLAASLVGFLGLGSYYLLAKNKLGPRIYLGFLLFCLALFRRTHVDGTMTPQKVDRNRVYTVCGYAIVACIVLIFVDSVFLRNSGLARFDPVFWLETVAVISFGVSWLTKGETLLGDPKPEAEAEAAPATEHVGLESPGV